MYLMSMKMRKFLFIDSETRGLPVNYDAPFTDTGNWPRIIQLAWELCYQNGETIRKSCSLVKPDGWVMPSKEFFMAKGLDEETAIAKSAFWTEHGYTQEKNEREGRPMPELLFELAQAMNEADVLVAHNLGYDQPIIECEFYRYKIYPKAVRREHPTADMRPAEVKLKKECTKLLSMPICKIVLGNKGDYKWPSLAEAYFFMFREGFEDAHDAGADVEACKKVYLWIQDYELTQMI